MARRLTTKLSDLITPPPLSLYIHFPWCVKKCPYCDFNSHALPREFDQRQYIQALIDDLDYQLTRFKPSKPLHSIFLGGGTPSLFEPGSLTHLLQHIAAQLEYTNDIEITLESNPGAVEHHNLESYRETGINRLSIGVQSFDASKLKTLGRIHTPDDIYDCFNTARAGGFENINIDLMFGLPDQNEDQALLDLESALQLEPEHLSLYQLTLEPNTVFYRYPPKLPGQDNIVSMQHALQAKLETHGFQQYEVSAYAKPDRECRHNLNYWLFGDYIGIGAGAHGKLTVDQRVFRSARKKHPATYIASAGTNQAIAESKQIPETEIAFEYLMNSLRLKRGFGLHAAERRTGIKGSRIRSLLDKHILSGLLVEFDDNLRCSEKGYLFLDNILVDLV